MKMIKVAVALVLLPLLAGCATEGYVNRQVDPLADRLGKLESKLAVLEAKRSVGETTAGTSSRELPPDDRAALREATELSKMAFEKACRLEEQVKRAESAAANASDSARKNQKMFELQQRK